MASASALDAEDYLFPIHRDLGAHIAKGQSVLNILLQYLGRGTSLTRGRDSGIHASDTSLNIIGNVSHLGAMIPVAVGVAMASKLRGDKVVSLNYIGEGGSNIGDFHEGLNFASVQQLPFVLIIENNQYAYSTPTHKGYRCEKLSHRANAYCIPGHFIDGTDALTVYSTVRSAVERARRGEGPSLIECRSMRMVGHSAHDDASYVDKKLLKEWEQKDPIANLEKKLLDEGILDRDKIEQIGRDIEQDIDAATEDALAAPHPEAGWAGQGVFAD